MEVYAPSYYKNFKCIADKCRHSCCINWEINIDETAYEKYKALKCGFAKELKSNIVKTESGAQFKLDGQKRCKNLDERGLCRIISSLGEEYLCDICRLHPRFFNDVGAHLEVGIGLCCEEAVRVVLLDSSEFSLECIGEREEEFADAVDFDALSLRNSVFSFCEREESGFFDKLSLIESKYRVNTDFFSPEEWIKFLLSFEILDKEWEDILNNSLKAERLNDVTRFDSYFERFFKYLVYRHVSAAENELDGRGRIAFSVLGARLVKYLAEREKILTEEKLFDIIRLYSSEIEYSEENTENLIFELETELL